MTIYNRLTQTDKAYQRIFVSNGKSLYIFVVKLVKFFSLSFATGF